jgi:D-glycero-alpha-D-manno-heptose 1-phosphate guanylyltransferase
MQAIILAGGLGTRLKSVVADKPKALSPVAGKPFLHFIIQYLQNQGITSFIFSLGYLSNQVLIFLQEAYPNLNYQYTIEEIPLGTGGGIKKAIELATEPNVLIVNADTYFDVALQQLFQLHAVANAHCTIALKHMTSFDRYGTVELNQNNRIISFKEKKYTPSGLINGGYVLLNKSYFLEKSAVLPTVFSFEKDFLEVLLPKMTVQGFISEGFFIDIGIPEDYEKAQLDFMNFA